MRLRKRDLPVKLKSVPAPVIAPSVTLNNSEVLNSQRAMEAYLKSAHSQIIEVLRQKKPVTYKFDVKRNSRGLIDTVVARPV